MLCSVTLFGGGCSPSGLNFPLDIPKVAVLHPDLGAEPQALRLSKSQVPTSRLCERVIPTADVVMLSTEQPCDAREGFLIASSC